jgi:hypothetical protein
LIEGVMLSAKHLACSESEEASDCGAARKILRD